MLNSNVTHLPHLVATADHIFRAARLVAGAMILERNPAVTERLNNALAELDLATQKYRSCDHLCMVKEPA